MDPLSIAAIAVIAATIFGRERQHNRDFTQRIFRWFGRAFIGSLSLLLVVVGWYTVAAMPVSVAIILGAIIIVIGIRSSTGMGLRLMEGLSERQRLRRYD